MLPQHRPTTLVSAPPITGGSGSSSSSVLVDDSIETSILFWIHAACRSSRAPSPPPSFDTADLVAPPPPPSLDAGAESSTKRPRDPAVYIQTSPTDSPEDPVAVGNSTSATPPRGPVRWPSPPLLVRDAMPLYGTLLAGHLGPVCIDVVLLGHVSLLHHTEQFERTVASLASDSAGRLKDLMREIQPFFMLHHGGGRDDDGVENEAPVAPPFAAMYTLDPCNGYPTLPLLAQLLRESKVRKVLLHSRLLYRLLFLFLGTDRIEVANVVEVALWSQLAQQLRPSLKATFALPDEVRHLSDIMAALPREEVEVLQADVQAMESQCQPPNCEAADRREDAGEQEEEASLSSTHSNSSTSPESGRTSYPSPDKHRVETPLPSVTTAGATFSTPPRGRSGELEAEEEDAVQLLQHIVPLDVQPIHRRRRRPEAALGCSASEKPPSAELFYGLRGLQLFYKLVLSDMADATAQRRAIIYGSLTETEAALCHRRTYAAFLCEVMEYHGVNVASQLYHDMIDTITAQMDQLEASGRATMEALHRHQRPGALSRTEVGTAISSIWTEEAIRNCLVDQQLLPTAPASDVKTRPVKIDKALLKSLVLEAAAAIPASDLRIGAPDEGASPAQSRRSPRLRRESGTAAAVLLLKCELAGIWMAFQERAEHKRKLIGMFSNLNDRIDVRVIETGPQLDPAKTSPPPPSPTSPVASASTSAACMVSRGCLCFSVHPHWTLYNASTGRIFSAMPNVQTVAKQPPMVMYSLESVLDGHDVETQDVSEASMVQRLDRLRKIVEATESAPAAALFPQHRNWTTRCLYVAPPGCTFISFDFNQLELRLLAHLSGDAALIRDLSMNVDVLALITQQVLQLPSVNQVTKHQRQAIKVIVYGLLYGMGIEAMAIRLQHIVAELNTSSPIEASSAGSGESRKQTLTLVSARNLVDAFHRVYPRVQGYLRDTRLIGLHQHHVLTLSGRKLSLSESDPNRRKQSAVAYAIQGGAADVLHCGMHAVHKYRHQILPYLPAAPLALLMTIHDELIYAVPEVVAPEVARAVRDVLRAQADVLQLQVPLPVSVRKGESFGNLEEFGL